MSNRPPKSNADEVIHRGNSCSCLWEGTVPVVSLGRLSPRSQQQQQGWALQKAFLPWEGKAAMQDTRCFCRDISGRTWVCSWLRQPGIPLGKCCHSSLCGPCPLMVKSILPSQPARPETQRLSRGGENAGCEGSEADICLQTPVMSLG